MKNTVQSETFTLGFENISAQVSNAVQRLTDGQASVLQKGFRCIIDLRDNSENHAKDLKMKISQGGGGSFAEAKMHTLELFPDIAMTGTDTVQQFVARIEADKALKDNLPAATWEELQSLGASEIIVGSHLKINRALQIILRDHLKLTSYLGGIRVPYETVTNRVGELKIAFSGLSQEQDLLMSLMIFERVQVALNQQIKNDWYYFDFSELKKNEFATFNLNLLGAIPLLKQ